MITQQEKIREAIGKMERPDEYNEILHEQQELTLGMLSAIESQQQKERDRKMQHVLGRIEQLEREKLAQNMYNYTTDRI